MTVYIDGGIYRGTGRNPHGLYFEFRFHMNNQSRRTQSPLSRCKSGRRWSRISLRTKCSPVNSLRLLMSCIYAVNLTQAYGAAGVTKVVRILEREILTGMQLLGARNVSELVPEMVCLLGTFTFLTHKFWIDGFFLKVERVDWQAVISAKM